MRVDRVIDVRPCRGRFYENGLFSPRVSRRDRQGQHLRRRCKETRADATGSLIEGGR